MRPFRLYATTGDAVARLDSLDGERVVAERNLEGRGAMCVAAPTTGARAARHE